jgi:hypothetical protein
MGRDELRGRTTWQDYSGANAGAAEKSFFETFSEAFNGTNFRIRAKPQEFANIYVNVELTDAVAAAIYAPDRKITKHGITPDYAIDNVRSGKTLYVEVKRQDGWVEGKDRSAGRGNAHERSCKYFTPGLLKILREAGKLGPDVLPFWTVFQGDITRDPCRVRETTCWYGEHWAHIFMWRDTRDASALVRHFDEHLKSLLL